MPKIYKPKIKVILRGYNTKNKSHSFSNLSQRKTWQTKRKNGWIKKLKQNHFLNPSGMIKVSVINQQDAKKAIPKTHSSSMNFTNSFGKL